MPRGTISGWNFATAERLRWFGRSAAALLLALVPTTPFQCKACQNDEVNPVNTYLIGH